MNQKRFCAHPECPGLSVPSPAASLDVAVLRALIAEMRDMPSDDRIQRWADRLAALLPKE